MSLSSFQLFKINLPQKFRALVAKMSSLSLYNDTVVAVCQMTSTDDKEENFQCCESLVQAAKKQNAAVCLIRRSVMNLFSFVHMFLKFYKDGIPA